MSTDKINYVGLLQEYFQSIKSILPSYGDYKVVEFDKNCNQNIFQVEIKIKNGNKCEEFLGIGTSKAEAKQDAAKQAHDFLNLKSFHYNWSQNSVQPIIKLLRENISTHELNKNERNNNINNEINNNEINNSEKTRQKIVQNLNLQTECRLNCSNINENIKNTSPRTYPLLEPINNLNNINNNNNNSINNISVMVDADNIDIPISIVEENSHCRFYLFKSRNGTKNLDLFQKYTNCQIITSPIPGKDVTDHYITWYASHLYYESKLKNINTLFIIVTRDKFGLATQTFCEGLLACSIGELQNYLTKSQQ